MHATCRSRPRLDSHPRRGRRGVLQPAGAVPQAACWRRPPASLLPPPRGQGPPRAQHAASGCHPFPCPALRLGMPPSRAPVRCPRLTSVPHPGPPPRGQRPSHHPSPRPAAAARRDLDLSPSGTTVTSPPLQRWVSSPTRVESRQGRQKIPPTTMFPRRRDAEKRQEVPLSSPPSPDVPQPRVERRGLLPPLG